MAEKKEFIAKIQQHQALINKLLFLYANTQEDRKDLRQEILTQAWRSYKNFRGEAKFSTWLYRVGINVAIASLKKHKRHNMEIMPQPSVAPSHSEKELLEKILMLMNPVEKSIILFLVEGYEQPEIAEMLGITGENIRVKIHRIRKKLKSYGIERFME